MHRTHHLQKRLSQRGIRSDIIELLEKYGQQDGDKIILTRKDCQMLSQVFARLKKTADKMAEKGGYVLVTSGGALITAYRLDSYNINRAKNKSHQSHETENKIVDESTELQKD